MNDTTKIILAIGGAIAVGLVVYYVTKDKDDKEKKVTAEAKKSNKIVFTR